MRLKIEWEVMARTVPNDLPPDEKFLRCYLMMESTTTTATVEAPASTAVKTATHATMEPAAKSSAHRSAMEPPRRSPSMEPNGTTVESAAHSVTMKTTCYKSATRTTGHESTARPARRKASVEATGKSVMKTTPMRYEAAMEIVMHMEIIVHESPMRKIATMRVEMSSKPARERIEERRGIPTAVIIGIGVIRIPIVSADINDRRGRLRSIIGVAGVRARGCAGRRLSDYGSLGGIRFGSLRICSGSRPRLIPHLRATLQHRSNDLRRNPLVAQLDNFIRARLKRPGRRLHERKHDRLVDTGFRQCHNIIDSTGKLRGGTAGNRTRRRLGGFGLDRVSPKARTRERAANG